MSRLYDFQLIMSLELLLTRGLCLKYVRKSMVACWLRLTELITFVPNLRVTCWCIRFMSWQLNKRRFIVSPSLHEALAVSFPRTHRFLCNLSRCESRSRRRLKPKEINSLCEREWKMPLKVEKMRAIKICAQTREKKSNKTRIWQKKKSAKSQSENVCLYDSRNLNIPPSKLCV